jgi:hypothetical protein
MSKYKMQYWLYVILNKQFGKEVKFTRDSLHRRYEVNRHAFEVSTNTLSLHIVEKWLQTKLIESAFESVKDDPGCYSKNIGNKKFYIYVKEQKKIDGSKPTLNLSVYAYKF